MTTLKIETAYVFFARITTPFPVNCTRNFKDNFMRWNFSFSQYVMFCCLPLNMTSDYVTSPTAHVSFLRLRHYLGQRFSNWEISLNISSWIVKTVVLRPVQFMNEWMCIYIPHISHSVSRRFTILLEWDQTSACILSLRQRQRQRR